MKYKEIEPKYKNKYVIEVKFMHGDADEYTTEEFICKNEAECTEVMKALSEDTPQDPASGGSEEEYAAWELKVFKSEDFIPYDCTGYDCPASYQNAKAFYYNQDGTKFEVIF